MPTVARRPRSGPCPLSAERSGRRLAVAVAGLVLAAAGCSPGGGLSVEPLPDPPPTSATTTSEVPPDLSEAALPSATGRTTTTTVAIGPGGASLQGTVTGPGGPVPGATVRVERLVGDAVVTSDLASTDGTWSLPGVNGGRYRVRAWRTPDLAQLVPAQFFVGAQESYPPVDLKLDRFVGPHAVATVAPSPPTVDQPATVAVQVTERSVDASGVVRAVPRPLTRVELSVSPAAWLLRSPGVTFTDSSGRARWDLACRAPGPQPITVVVDAATPLPLALAPCAEAPSVATDPAGDGPAGNGPGTTGPAASPTTRRP